MPDHITPVLRELHWLPIRERVKFKVACLVRQSLFGQASLCLADDCCLVSDSTRRSLQSADVPTCVVPRTLIRRQNFCSRWTSLVELSSGPAAQSRHHLRTVQTTVEGTLFFGSINTALCDILRKTLTYLLTYLFIRRKVTTARRNDGGTDCGIAMRWMHKQADVASHRHITWRKQKHASMASISDKQH